VAAWRVRLLECEEGKDDPALLFADWKEQGIETVELALRPGDPRVVYWRAVLEKTGARRIKPWPRSGYEMYQLP